VFTLCEEFYSLFERIRVIGEPLTQILFFKGPQFKIYLKFILLSPQVSINLESITSYNGIIQKYFIALYLFNYL